MPAAPYRTAHLSEVITPAGAEPGEAAWRAVRIHFGIGSFGVAAYAAEAAGEVLTSVHDELGDSETRHEELFYVAAGRATFSVDGEDMDAPAGTFVYVPDPATRRGATAVEAGTVLLAMGGEPGAAFAVSPWEQKYLGDG